MIVLTVVSFSTSPYPFIFANSATVISYCTSMYSRSSFAFVVPSAGFVNKICFNRVEFYDATSSTISNVKLSLRLEKSSVLKGTLMSKNEASDFDISTSSGFNSSTGKPCAIFSSFS